MSFSKIVAFQASTSRPQSLDDCAHRAVQTTPSLLSQSTPPRCDTHRHRDFCSTLEASSYHVGTSWRLTGSPTLLRSRRKSPIWILFQRITLHSAKPWSTQEEAHPTRFPQIIHPCWSPESEELLKKTKPQVIQTLLRNSLTLLTHLDGHADRKPWKIWTSRILVRRYGIFSDALVQRLLCSTSHPE